MSDTTSLQEVAQALAAAGLRDRDPVAHVALTGVAQDSRRVQPGDLFLAWVGEESDGHDFLAAALQAGAVAAVVERSVPGVAIEQVVVANGRLGAAVAADVVHGSPWRSMRTTAVTGTNGKTTTTLLVRWLLGLIGPATAVGTLGLTEADGSIRPGTERLTTPGPADLSSWLADLRDRGARSVTMEASSHALAQHRLDGVRFDAAVFTNVTQDHLDYHGDMAGYLAAKRRLVELLAPNGTVVVNQSDSAWEGLEGPGDKLTFGTDASADIRASALRLEHEHTRFLLEYGDTVAEVNLPLLGAFNVENALAAAGAAIAAGLGLESVAARLTAAPQIPGRLERVTGPPFTVLIDYAHTPDALARVLRAVRPLTQGRLLAVFGAGGDRDRAKRPLMGRAAAENADIVIVTSDNPRTEDPEAIIDEILPGLEGATYHRDADRRAAVVWALDLAAPGDVVLLAGKGHELYQVIGTEKTPLDEREIIREWMGGRAA